MTSELVWLGRFSLIAAIAVVSYALGYNRPEEKYRVWIFAVPTLAAFPALPLLPEHPHQLMNEILLYVICWAASVLFMMIFIDMGMNRRRQQQPARDPFLPKP